MAAYGPAASAHKTSGVATVDSVLLNTYGAVIQVFHRGATTDAPIYFTVGNTVADTTTPVSAADGTYVVTGATSVVVPWPAGSAGQQAAVKLICAAAVAYSVQVLPARAF